MRLLLDSREPDPHPWKQYLPEGWSFERGLLETGDVAISALPDGGVVERKTASDLVSCIGVGRERFERELRRSRHVGKFVVVVEGSFEDVLASARGMHRHSIIGSISSWVLRYCPIVFCGSERLAAEFAFRFLAAQIRDIRRPAKAIDA
jgi:ERCC4-type nuclease